MKVRLSISIITQLYSLLYADIDLIYRTWIAWFTLPKSLSNLSTLQHVINSMYPTILYIWNWNNCKLLIPFKLTEQILEWQKYYLNQQNSSFFPMQPIQINGKTVNDAYRFTGHTGGIRAMLGWKHFIITGSDDNSIKVGNFLLNIKRYGRHQRATVSRR